MSRPSSRPRACIAPSWSSDFRTVVIDEFHERSIHADLGLALARQAMIARDDLRVVVMSATMDAAPVAAFLLCQRETGRREAGTGVTDV
jgi:HrpA-like RNA helicase